METFLGQIVLLPFNFAPAGFLPCDGSLLSIDENTALFALLGTQFGGDGQTTFALPQLEDAAPGVGYYIAMTGIFPPRP